MNDFEYQAVTTVDDAVRLLADRGDRARILAGGTDILVHLREGHCEADLIVDIKKIPEAMQLSFHPDGGLWLGSGVPCSQIYRESRIVAQYAALVDATRIIGGWQIQSRASVGGNLCNASPAADSTPVLIGYDVMCHIAGPSGRRTVPVAEFCLGPGKNVLEPGELLTALWFPPPAPRSGAAYLRFIPRNEMDIAVAGACSWVRLNEAGDTIEEARIALAAVAPTAILAHEAAQSLSGRPATEESYAAAAKLAANAASPISDMRGTIEFRRHLAGVLTKRTLAIAVERALLKKTED